MTNAQIIADPTHPQHASVLSILGKFLGAGLVVLAAYQAQDQSPLGAGIFLNPATVLPYLQGLIGVFGAQPAQQ